jgi:AbrB family looped-hinge helix DNA binding protein
MPYVSEAAMTTLTITAKGQITLKKSLLQHLGLGPGDRVEVEEAPEGGLRIHAPVSGHPIQDFFGVLEDKVTRSVSLEDMDRIIADGWAGRL